MSYSVVTMEGHESLTALIGGELKVATSSHPNYAAIKAAVVAGDLTQDTANLFDLTTAINSAFGEVTDRVTVNRDGVLLDGEPVHGAITRVLIALVEQGDRDGFVGLARFLERLQDNPSHRSREQLYGFIEANGISVDVEGNIVLYKSVARDGNGGYKSHAIGTAFVNGVKHTGQIPSKVGDVVSMPRSEISDDPNVACHAGLHAGAEEYARSFYSGSPVLRVLVGPEHVVSVPADSKQQKLRTEEYTIGDVVDGTLPAYWSGGLVGSWDEDDDLDEDEDYDLDDEDDEDYEFDSEATVWGW